jgi:RecB family exonuclease
MKAEWLKYERIPAPPLWTNLRWDRVARLPILWAKGFVKWLTASPQEMTPNRVTAYLNCPQKYAYQYVDKRPSRPSGHLTFYQAVHESLLHFHRRIQADPKATVDDLLRVYQSFWSQDGFADVEEEQTFYARGVAILERFMAANHGQPPPAVTGVPVEVEVGGVKLKARVDRIDKHTPKKWTVTQYKTGGRIMEEASLANDRNAQLFFLLVRTKWPKVDLEVKYHYLVPDRVVALRMRADELTSAKSNLTEASGGVGEGAFPPKTGHLCGWCDHQALCPAWDGYTTERTRFRWSYSKMMTYVRCPRNYKALYVDHIAPLPRNFFSIGTSLHNALEEFFVYDGLLKQPTFGYLMRLFAEHWETAGYKDEADEKAHVEDGIRMLRDYYQREIDGKFRRAWSVEPYFELPIGDKSLLLGFIDRIARHDDGRYEVIDYKTEPKIRTQEEVDEDLQLTVYYWACCVAFKIVPAQLSLHFMRHNKNVDTRRGDEDVRKLEQFVNEVTEQVLAEKEYAPKLNKYCSSCDHLRGCPKEAEVMEQMKAGKTMHKIDPDSVKPANAAPGPIEGEETAAHEKQVDAVLKRETSS